MTQRKQDAVVGGKGGPSFNCPVCHGVGRVASSYRLSHLTRRVHYFCRDEHCGHTWSCMLEYERTLSPSAKGPVDRNAPYLKGTMRPPIGAPIPKPPDSLHPPPD